MTGVTLDSRAVLPGDLYAALPGARAHGADFAGQAASAGAVAVLTDPAGVERMRAAGGTLPAVVVPHPRAVLGAVAAHVYGTEHLALRLIGVTGTNGKTTTAYLVAVRAGGDGPPPRPDRHRRDPDRRRAPRQRAHDPRGARAARRARRDGRAWPRHLRHGGLQPRPGPAAGSTASSTTSRCSPTSRRTTSTSTTTWRTTSPRRPRSSRRSGPVRAWSASTTTGGAGSSGWPASRSARSAPPPTPTGASSSTAPTPRRSGSPAPGSTST